MGPYRDNPWDQLSDPGAGSALIDGSQEGTMESFCREVGVTKVGAIGAQAGRVSLGLSQELRQITPLICQEAVGSSEPITLRPGHAGEGSLCCRSCCYIQSSKRDLGFFSPK